MAVPDYIVRMRKHIGHDLLWLPSVSAVIRNDADELLLGKRADDGRWSIISGFVESGEQPAAALLREVREETGLDVAPVRMSSAVSHPHTYPNGDQCEILNLGFLCRVVSGTARVNDDESVAVRWFPLDRLPELTPHDLLVIAYALRDNPLAGYLPPGTNWEDIPT
ncbi:NUDIX domain-containing protein [Micromonospora lupini]|uniref:NUDIX hydrolase n=1 Tax=Micromonospora lupini TaxID=285679 RepID=UPI00225858E2|nr:NUDIX domain-containing protein [Micromonospora lupini]MCX5066529.1 NUDIX domain-containing protein [Micromonospora lupini]